MRKQRVTYFIFGLILQLAIISVIVYWFTLVSTGSLEAAIDHFSAKLPSFLQDTTVMMIIVAAFTALSMICYGGARNYSLSQSFRTLTMGLILIDAIILLWLILALM
jgi:hypothetical protein